jgi:hypothetical protein
VQAAKKFIVVHFSPLNSIPDRADSLQINLVQRFGPQGMVHRKKNL